MTARKIIAYASLAIFYLPLYSFAADIIGYAWPKTDLLIADTSKGQFKLLQVWRRYDLVKQIDTGYVILWENTDGSPRLAFIPFRDRLTNPTATRYEPPITLINIVGITAQPAFVPLNAGERFPVVSRTNGTCLVLFTFNVLTQTVAVAETNVSYVSLTDYTGVLKKLIASADRLITTTASAEHVSSVFSSYSGKFATETAKEREELAMKYSEQAALASKRVFEAEQTAKGLVEFRGDWLTPAEKGKRLAAESEAVARAAQWKSEQAQRAEAASRDDFGSTIVGNNWVGCTSRDYYSKLVGYAVDKDDSAFNQALAAGLLTGECTQFRNGERVYITDTAIFRGLVKVRRRGGVVEYWTATEAVK